MHSVGFEPTNRNEMFSFGVDHSPNHAHNFLLVPFYHF